MIFGGEELRRGGRSFIGREKLRRGGRSFVEDGGDSLEMEEIRRGPFRMEMGKLGSGAFSNADGKVGIWCGNIWGHVRDGGDSAGTRFGWGRRRFSIGEGSSGACLFECRWESRGKSGVVGCGNMFGVTWSARGEA